MPSRSISIKEEIYNQLDKYRLMNESFSEAIKRLLDSNADILDLAGAWKKISDVEPALDMVEKVVKKLHEEENNIKLI
ncbi:MAG: antitoxin VapB family protein [Promethearchaeota archaeon]